MTTLDDGIRALCGRGVSLCATSSNQLTLSIKRGNLQPQEVQPIKDNKALVLLLLPIGCDVSAAHFENALEHYREREAMLVYGGIDTGSAGLKALSESRAFLLSLLS